MPFPDIENSTLLFVYSKKHDDTPREDLRFRYGIAEKCPLFKGKPYTSAMIIGVGLNPETYKYFEEFDDAIVLGIGTIKDVVAGDLK